MPGNQGGWMVWFGYECEYGVVVTPSMLHTLLSTLSTLPTLSVDDFYEYQRVICRIE